MGAYAKSWESCGECWRLARTPFGWSLRKSLSFRVNSTASRWAFLDSFPFWEVSGSGQDFRRTNNWLAGRREDEAGWISCEQLEAQHFHCNSCSFIAAHCSQTINFLYLHAQALIWRLYEDTFITAQDWEWCDDIQRMYYRTERAQTKWRSCERNWRIEKRSWRMRFHSTRLSHRS